MGFRLGIVGLPNVGKSTLFNALVKASRAQVASYPFTTIDPNVGKVPVPDKRLEVIAEREGSERATPTFIEFVDIAGLVKGASRGEGLGNQFLAHIREVDAIAMVVRCFERGDVPHVEGSLDPVRDVQIVDLELVMKDLETVKGRMSKVEKSARGGNREAREEMKHLKTLMGYLEDLEPLRRHLKDMEEETVSYAKNTLFLLTLKPVLYVANVSEEDLPDGDGNPCVEALKGIARNENSPLVVICADIESQIASLEEEEAEEFLKAYGLRERGLNRLIREGYKLLDLITFFTTNRKETRAWTVKRGTRAPEAAGKVHTDMERGFIAAEVINYRDYVKVSSLAEAREKGLVRLEGREYEVRDGDIIYFRFKV
ncbi:MAG: redox-regulated ATPase YchF [Aquificota bacterium]|nr:redox-regulated ATPase YchF [Aquificota bacterium]